MLLKLVYTDVRMIQLRNIVSFTRITFRSLESHLDTKMTRARDRVIRVVCTASYSAELRECLRTHLVRYHYRIDPEAYHIPLKETRRVLSNRYCVYIKLSHAVLPLVNFRTFHTCPVLHK